MLLRVNSMSRQVRKQGSAIQFLVDQSSGGVVGWLYRWDNGEESRLLVTDLAPFRTAPVVLGEQEAHTSLEPDED